MSTSPDWSIYTLFDSRAPDVVRYVGLTKDPSGRLRGHRTDKSRSHKACWVRSVLRDGGSIEMHVVASGLDYDQAVAAEIATIARMRAEGAKLTNATDGGEGVRGYEVTAELRARRSQNATGRRHTAEARARISEGQRGNRRPPETGERIASAKRMAPPRPGSFKGVYRRGKRWISNIYIDGKQRFLGTFENPEAAARAYDEAAIAAWGDRVCLNFPRVIAA